MAEQEKVCSSRAHQIWHMSSRSFVRSQGWWLYWQWGPKIPFGLGFPSIAYIFLRRIHAYVWRRKKQHNTWGPSCISTRPLNVIFSCSLYSLCPLDKNRYSILALSLLISLMTFWTVSTRSTAESFSAMWSTIIVVGLCIGGTMVMRRFHTSIAVGFFMGSVVATSQLFFLLFLV